MVRKIYHAGELAYHDTFTGLVPCKVVSVIEPGRGDYADEGVIRCRITAKRGAYHKGEVIQTSAYTTIPRKQVHSHGYNDYVNPFYEWK